MSGMVSTMDAASTTLSFELTSMSLVTSLGGLVEVLLFWLWGDDFGDGVVLFVVVGVVVGVFDGGVGVGVWGDDFGDGVVLFVVVGVVVGVFDGGVGVGGLFLSNFDRPQVPRPQRRSSSATVTFLVGVVVGSSTITSSPSHT